MATFPLAWSADVALPGFEMRRLNFPDDYDGAVYATLVRRKASTPTRTAVLYLHGFMDYFFQEHMADAYNEHGFHFYALDLRKYGRSLAEHHHPAFCKDLREYFAEISTALEIIAQEDGNDWILLSGHSTGGLTASLYAASGVRRDLVNALHLNSPFFDWNLSGVSLRLIQGLAAVGGILPFIKYQQPHPSAYMHSILKEYHGEWEMESRWRPVIPFPIYAGWCRAITKGHQRVSAGLGLTIPVLLMYSDKSIYGDTWHPDFQTGDSVLNVAHIRAGAKHLGPNVQEREIADGLHDLVLSRKDVREQVFHELFAWLEAVSSRSTAVNTAG